MPIKDGWFSESEVMWPGQAMSLKVEEVLFEGKSDFQEILVFRSSTYGTVLVLDGVIQLTERDEHAYQEMIAHIPLHCHPNPVNVLIVGGGDGGVLREVCRHPGVKHVTMCEIDKKVVDVAKKFLGKSTATAFNDPRVTLVHADAAQYVRDKKDTYDVVIVDSSDPVGPAETLFTATFYESLRTAMRPGAIMCNQGECMWLHLDLIGEVLKHCTQVFPSVDYAFTTIPTYPSGQIGFLMCSTTPNAVLRQPARIPAPSLQAQLKYYTPAVHASAFVLPAFAEAVVATVRRPALPHYSSSVAPKLLSGRNLAVAAMGMLAGAAAAMAFGARRK
jgi:spermidine synthase